VADLHFVNPQTNSRPAQLPSGGRQPLLWAALAFAAGIATGCTRGGHPFVGSGVRRHCSIGRVLVPVTVALRLYSGMGTLFVLGAFIIQVSGSDSSGESRVLQFADGSEVVVTAHVTKEGLRRRKVETFASAWISQPN